MHWHCVERLLPTGDWELDGHSSQLEGVVAPATVEYVPATQGRQVASEEAPTAAENLPAAQAAHAAEPAVGLNVPAAHAAHDPPLGV